MRAKHIDDCDAELLEAYLSERTSAGQEVQLFSHLESCQKCRAKLELGAAESTTWNSVREYLADTEHDSIQLSGLHDVLREETSEDGQEGDSNTAQVASVLSTLKPTDDPRMLGRLGPYEVSGVVGAGGMGIVLKGHDLSLERTVAIKVLAPHLASSGAARKRFAREAKAAAAVLHPNIMSIHGVKNDGPLPYLVMPYMRGASLQKRIDAQGPLSTKEILRVGSQIAAGLAAAHAQGLVHRDIKPANMMLENGLETVAITDFGLARAVDDATMTRSGVIAGTPQYMSPEQARGEVIDARSDLFSLGSLIYAMCTGRSPFRAETSFGVLQRIANESPRDIVQVNAEIPTWLCDLVAWLHEKSPDRRIQSAREVEQLLNDCLAHLEQPNVNELPASLLRRRKTRLRSEPWMKYRVLQIAAASMLLLIAFFGWQSYGKTTAATTGPEQKPVIGEPPGDGFAATEDAQSNADELPGYRRLWQELDEDLQELTEIAAEVQAMENTMNEDSTEGEPNR